jgi:hypothetical protein
MPANGISVEDETHKKGIEGSIIWLAKSDKRSSLSGVQTQKQLASVSKIDLTDSDSKPTDRNAKTEIPVPLTQGNRSNVSRVR